MTKKFTMELVWHNCYECKPEEITNDSLIMTNGIDVFEAFWYAPDGFMIHAKHGWHGVYEGLKEWYWADIRQTVRGDLRFRGVFVDDLVVDFKNNIDYCAKAATDLADTLKINRLKQGF